MAIHIGILTKLVASRYNVAGYWSNSFYVHGRLWTEKALST